jgi:phage baseplate assembly protein W
VKWSGGYFTTRTTKDLIKSSIRMILTTRLGERPMLPEFGSRLYELVFEPMDDGLKALARTFVIEALQRWEPRITLQSVLLGTDPDNNTFSISMTYVINENAEQDTLVLSGIGRQI